MPVIGFLNSASASEYARPIAAFRRGLSEAALCEGRIARPKPVVLTFRRALGLGLDPRVKAPDTGVCAPRSENELTPQPPVAAALPLASRRATAFWARTASGFPRRVSSRVPGVQPPRWTPSQGLPVLSQAPFSLAATRLC
jgi:hypothetical protein